MRSQSSIPFKTIEIEQLCTWYLADGQRMGSNTSRLTWRITTSSSGIQTGSMDMEDKKRRDQVLDISPLKDKCTVLLVWIWEEQVKPLMVTPSSARKSKLVLFWTYLLILINLHDAITSAANYLPILWPSDQMLLLKTSTYQLITLTLWSKPNKITPK